MSFLGGFCSIFAKRLGSQPGYRLKQAFSERIAERRHRRRERDGTGGTGEEGPWRYRGGTMRYPSARRARRGQEEEFPAAHYPASADQFLVARTLRNVAAHHGLGSSLSSSILNSSRAETLTRRGGSSSPPNASQQLGPCHILWGNPFVRDYRGLSSRDYRCLRAGAPQNIRDCAS